MGEQLARKPLISISELIISNPLVQVQVHLFTLIQLQNKKNNKKKKKKK